MPKPDLEDTLGLEACLFELLILIAMIGFCLFAKFGSMS